MDDIVVRYGESFHLSVETEEPTATTATLFVGRAGETPVITLPAQFNQDGIAYINGDPADTRKPLGTYYYQVNVALSGGDQYKYPTDEWCEDNGFPKFIIKEALDETEAV